MATEMTSATSTTAMDQTVTRGERTSAETPKTARTPQRAFMEQVAAILLMAAGWGWNSGNFVQPTNVGYGIIADVLHPLPLLLLLIVGLRYINAWISGTNALGDQRTISGIAWFSIIGCVVMIVLGLVNPDPNSVGVHSPEDWMPVVVVNAGNLLWLATLLFSGRGRAAAATTAA